MNENHTESEISMENIKDCTINVDGEDIIIVKGEYSNNHSLCIHSFHKNGFPYSYISAPSADDIELEPNQIFINDDLIQHNKKLVDAFIEKYAVIPDNRKFPEVVINSRLGIKAIKVTLKNLDKMKTWR